MRSITKALLLLLLAPTAVAAQAEPRSPSDSGTSLPTGERAGVPTGERARVLDADELVRTDPFDDDPIGVDPLSDVSDVQGPPPPPGSPAPESPEEIARRGPRPPSVAAQAGAVLTAINAVRETRHDVAVSLIDGLADVVVEMTIASRARHPAEVRYRLAIPDGSELAAITVCRGDLCREGIAAAAAGRARAAYDAALRARGPDDAPPIAYAERIDDERGPALELLLASVPPRGALEVRVRYVAPAPLVGGVARMVLPARGSDPRAAPSAVTLSADGMLAPSVDDAPAGAPLIRDAWYAIPISARLATGRPARARLAHFRCGSRRCVRAVVSAGPEVGAASDVVIAVDASPSMEGPARGRLAATLSALLAATPRGSRVWALSFAAEAEGIVEAPRDPAELPLLPLSRAAERDLGSATRIEAAWEMAQRFLAVGDDGRRRRGARGRPTRPAHLIVVGDGGMTRGPAADAAFGAARRAGVAISVVAIGDRAPWNELAAGAHRTAGRVIEAGAEAATAARGHSMAQLSERLSSLFAPRVSREVVLTGGGAPIVLGPLRAGEQLSFVGVLPGAGRARLSGAGNASVVRPDAALARGLAAMATGHRPGLVAIASRDFSPGADASDLACIDARGPARRASGVSSDAAPVALALPRGCPAAGAGASTTASSAALAANEEGDANHGEDSADDADDGLAGRGLPAETVLRMLRERVLPVARSCFRRDRGGRLDHSVRAELVLRLEDREITEARVEGRMSDTLRACLLGASHDLSVPRYDGAVVVRYPMFTARVAPPPTVELFPAVAGEVDAVIGPGADGGPSGRNQSRNGEHRGDQRPRRSPSDGMRRPRRP